MHLCHAKAITVTGNESQCLFFVSSNKGGDDNLKGVEHYAVGISSRTPRVTSKFKE